MTANSFDQKITAWKQETELPWAKLKYKLVRANLEKHLGQYPLRILDAGGGNGLDSILLAKKGHSVDIVDFSQRMLAEAQSRAAEESIQAQVTTHLADITNISSLFPNSHFDLILCHNVLQYLEDMPALFSAFSKLLKPAGIISVVSINRYSTPYHAAFLNNNLSEAYAQLDQRTSNAKIFEVVMTSYSATEICEMLKIFDLLPEKDYGIRCLCDYWGNNELKSDPAIFEQIERLEFALTDRHPYKLLARYFQVIARKAKSL